MSRASRDEARAARRALRGTITREEARDMAEAHGEGWHADLPREGCPECEGRELREYPPAAEVEEVER